MSESFIIQGGKSLSGSIDIQGSKNAALEALATSLVTDRPCHFFNVPEIEDVTSMLGILESVGVTTEHPNQNEYVLTAKNIIPEKLDVERIAQIRASIIVMGALAARTKTFTLVAPGGDKIGSRPLDPHFEAFRKLGFVITEDEEKINVAAPSSLNDAVTLSEISVTATINVLLALARQPQTVTIYCAAQDHSVLEVEWALQKLGVTIEGIGTHTLKITGSEKLSGMRYEIMPDPVETGTLIALAAATRSSVTLENTSMDFLRQELEFFEKIGVALSFDATRTHESGNYSLTTIQVNQHTSLKPVRHLHNMPAPGIIPDVLPPFAVLLTQAEGTSLIHDWMYEGRLRYIGELVKMGASAHTLDPHRAIIIGPTKLFGKEITSFDIRAGATLIIAALIAEGESKINDVYHIDRGYERIEERLQQIGAAIKRI